MSRNRCRSQIQCTPSAHWSGLTGENNIECAALQGDKPESGGRGGFPVSFQISFFSFFLNFEI